VAENLAVMSDEKLAWWVTFHERRLAGETERARQLREEGSVLRSEDYHADLVASALKTAQLSETALLELRAEMERRAAP
jgi:hypothetical protein